MNVLNKITNFLKRKKNQEISAFDCAVESLQQHKIEVELDEDKNRCSFHYGLNYYIYKCQDDPEYFSMYAFGICDVNKGNELMVYRAINEVNKTMKLAKFGIHQDCVHMEIPALITQKEDTNKMLARCFTIGHDAFTHFREEMEKQEKEESEKRVRVVGFH